MTIVDLSSRAEIIEEMDRPDSPQDRLYRTLAQFQLVNRIFSRYRSVLTRSVLQDMAMDGSRTYRLADLGAGGCDIARWLIGRCRERGLRLAISAVEHDPRVARYARAANAGYSESGPDSRRCMCIRRDRRERSSPTNRPTNSEAGPPLSAAFAQTASRNPENNRCRPA